jgi:hypothetical protein
MQRLSADAEQRSDFTDSPIAAEFRHHIFCEDDAGRDGLPGFYLLAIDRIFLSHSRTTILIWICNNRFRDISGIALDQL